MVSLKAIVLALALTGCGDTVTNNYYSDNASESDGEQPDTNSTNPPLPCQNSPFVNTHLQLVAEKSSRGCDYGTTEPLHPDCTGVLGEGYINEEGLVDDYEPFTYSENTLHFPGFVHEDSDPHTRRANPFEWVTLRRNPTASDFPSSLEGCNGAEWVQSLEESDRQYREAFWTSAIQRFLCYFSEDPSLYWGETEYPCDLFAWRNSPEPWVDETHCVATELNKPWYTNCQEQFLYPAPSDFE